MKPMVASMLFVSLVLGGCATSGTHMQAECEARFTSFSPIYWCTREAIAERNPGIMQDARAKLYMLRGEQLAQEVDVGRMSSIGAKVEWQRLYVELKAAKDLEVMAALATIPRIAPPAASVVPQAATPSAQVNCTSQRIGDSVFTNCLR